MFLLTAVWGVYTSLEAYGNPVIPFHEDVYVDGSRDSVELCILTGPQGMSDVACPCVSVLSVWHKSMSVHVRAVPVHARAYVCRLFSIAVDAQLLLGTLNVRYW